MTSKQGKLAHAIRLAVTHEPVPPKPRPLFDSSDPRWQAARREAEQQDILITTAYDRLYPR